MDFDFFQKLEVSALMKVQMGKLDKKLCLMRDNSTIKYCFGSFK